MSNHHKTLLNQTTAPLSIETHDTNLDTVTMGELRYLYGQSKEEIRRLNALLHSNATEYTTRVETIMTKYRELMTHQGDYGRKIRH